jgi:hypothetical protein
LRQMGGLMLKNCTVRALCAYLLVPVAYAADLHTCKLSADPSERSIKAYGAVIFLVLSHLPAATFCRCGGKGGQRQPPPPFTYTVSAVMNWQASEHMNSTSSAISSGSAKRFIGTSSRKRCTSSGELLAAA